MTFFAKTFFAKLKYFFLGCPCECHKLGYNGCSYCRKNTVVKKLLNNRNSWTNIDNDGDYDLVLYTASGSTVLRNFDLDNRASTSNQNAIVHFADQELAANTDYILAAVPSTLTNIILYSIDVGSAAELDQLPGGQNFHYAEASSPTTTADFTATTTRRPLLGVAVTALDDGASAGGESSSVFG